MTTRIPPVDSIRIIPRSAEFLSRKLGSRGEVFFDQESNTLRLFDGIATGGISLLKADFSNAEGTIGATLSATSPTGFLSKPGSLWFNTNTGRLYVRYFDGTSEQWVQPADTSFNNGTPNSAVINFPNAPTLNQEFTAGDQTWVWTGEHWDIKPESEPTFTNLTVTDTITGNVTGDVTGNVLGNVTGDVTGNTTGAHTGSVLGNVTGNVTGNVSGNAGTATALQTARYINNVAFNGTADITVPADANTLIGTTLHSNVVHSSLTSVGTLDSVTVTGDITANSNVVVSQAPTSATHATNKKYVDGRSIAISVAMS